MDPTSTPAFLERNEVAVRFEKHRGTRGMPQAGRQSPAPGHDEPCPSGARLPARSHGSIMPPHLPAFGARPTALLARPSAVPPHHVRERAVPAARRCISRHALLSLLSRLSLLFLLFLLSLLSLSRSAGRDRTAPGRGRPLADHAPPERTHEAGLYGLARAGVPDCLQD